MTGLRLVNDNDRVIDITPRRINLAAEIRRLADLAHGEDMAEVLALARSPLTAEEGLPEPDPEVEAALADRLRKDEALRASAAELVRPLPLTAAAQIRSRRFVIRPRQRAVLTASGMPVPGAYELVAAVLHGERPSTLSERRRR